jgi:hypothetical protein
MKTNKYVQTDFRKYELRWDKGLFNTIFLELTQLELLKIRKCLLKTKNVDLALKVEKLIKGVDNESRTDTNFERTLPYKTNGTRVKQWQSLADIQTVD